MARLKRKPYKKHRERAAQLFKYWTHILGLDWYDILITFYDRDKRFRQKNGTTIACKVWTDWRYMTIAISVNVVAVRDMSDDMLENTVVHELIHVLVNEMREKDPQHKHEERVVTQITKSVLWVRDLTRKEGQDGRSD